MYHSIVERSPGMFPHPRPDVRALDASASIPPPGEAIPCAFILFTFFYTFSVGEKSNKRWNSNVFIAFFSYTFTLVYSFCMLKGVTNVGIPTFLLTLLHLFLSLEGRAPSKILPNRWNHWDFLRFPSLWKSRKVYVPTSTAMVPLPGMVIL